MYVILSFPIFWRLFLSQWSFWSIFTQFLDILSFSKAMNYENKTCLLIFKSLLIHIVSTTLSIFDPLDADQKFTSIFPNFSSLSKLSSFGFWHFSNFLEFSPFFISADKKHTRASKAGRRYCWVWTDSTKFSWTCEFTSLKKF